MVLRNFKKVGPPKFDEADLEPGQGLQATIRAEFGLKEKKVLSDTIEELPAKPYQDAGSTDVGRHQLARADSGFGTACFAAGSPGHSWQNVAAIGSPIGHKGMMVAAKVMALSAVDLLQDPMALRGSTGRFSGTHEGSAVHDGDSQGAEGTQVDPMIRGRLLRSNDLSSSLCLLCLRGSNSIEPQRQQDRRDLNSRTGKLLSRLSLIHEETNPQAAAVVTVDRVDPVAKGRANILRSAPPGTAADDAEFAIFRTLRIDHVIFRIVAIQSWHHCRRCRACRTRPQAFGGKLPTGVVFPR